MLEVTLARQKPDREGGLVYGLTEPSLMVGLLPDARKSAANYHD